MLSLWILPDLHVEPLLLLGSVMIFFKFSC